MTLIVGIRRPDDDNADDSEIVYIHVCFVYILCTVVIFNIFGFTPFDDSGDYQWQRLPV